MNMKNFKNFFCHFKVVGLISLLLVMGVITTGAARAQSLQGRMFGMKSPYGQYKLRIARAGENVGRRCDTALRRRIFGEMIRAEAQATVQAAQMYPTPARVTRTTADFAGQQQMRQFQAIVRLIRRYHADVARRYHLTDDERAAIHEEGTARGW